MEWFRFYESTLDNVKIQSLPGEIVKGWLNLLCLANSGNGVLPPLRTIAFRLRLGEPDTQALLQILLREGLIDEHDGYLEMHDWTEYQRVSDNSADRTRRYRERQTVKMISKSTGENGAKTTVTSQVTSPSRERDALETETETEQKRREIDKSISVEQAPQESDPVPDNPKQQAISEAQQRIQESVQEIAPRIKARHPEMRNGMSANAIQNKLYAILKRHHVKAAQAPEFLAAIDQRHKQWCQCPQWQDKGGVYAKALSNWLSPREDRYLEEPATVSAPLNGKATEKQATTFNREIYGEVQPIKRTAEEIELLREQAQDECPNIRQAALTILAEYQIPEVSSWKNECALIAISRTCPIRPCGG
jgi:hypothetical protein